MRFLVFFFSNSQLLAGSRVNDVDKHRQTGLHIAAANNRASIISVLLENGVDPDATDEKGNNGIVLIFYLHFKDPNRAVSVLKLLKRVLFWC